MTKEEYDKLLGLGNENVLLEDEIRRQLLQAENLRAMPMEMRQAGRVTVAPHWMELLGNLARERASQISRDKAKGEQEKRRANTAEQNAMVAAILSRSAAPAAAEPVGPGLMPGAGGEGLKTRPKNPFSFGGAY
jgi:hypothetical protein